MPLVGRALPISDFRLSLPSWRTSGTIIAHVTHSVLVVDDDPAFRKLARRLLAASGLTVVGESAGVRAALADAMHLRPAACLVDVELPDGDGVTLARVLSALPWHPRVVLTSINAEIVANDEVSGSGAEAFVAKSELPNAPLSELLRGE
jgi:CheY-like chemotaxis protein